MAAWTNNKATAIPIKQVIPGRLSKPVEPTDLEPGAPTISVKAIEGKHQDAAIKAAQVLASALGATVGLTGTQFGTNRGHVTITMSGTSTNPPANGDVISVSVTLANAPAQDKETDVQGRV